MDLNIREKIILSVTITVVFFSILIIPIMTEVSTASGKYPLVPQVPIFEMFVILFYAHVVTFVDQFYLLGWYVGYSIGFLNPSMQFAHFLNSITETSFSFVFASSVFGYLEAPPWNTVYVFPAMYVPLVLIVPMWFFSKGITVWKRVLYGYLVVVQFSTILRLMLLFTL